MSSRETQVVSLTCYNLSIGFSPVSFLRPFISWISCFVLDTVHMFTRRTLAPSLPPKWRRLPRPRAAHRRYRLHFALLIFILLTWQVFVFTQLPFFSAHSVFDLKLKKKKTGRAKQLSTAKYPAFPKSLWLTAILHCYDEALQPQKQEIDFFFF